MKTNALYSIAALAASLALACCTSAKEESAFDEMSYSPSGTTFTLWSPEAEAVCVNIYQSADPDEQPMLTAELDKKDNGYWKCTVDTDLMDKFYAFQITQGGIQLQECPGINAHAVGLNGHRGAIIDWAATNPEGWDSDIRPALGSADEIILYEVHHRDLTMDSESGITNKGRFLAYTEHGTTNSYGESTGIDHLVDLGVTHIHILPSFDGAGDEILNEYNWGYDPLNYNVPEGKYSSDPANPYARVKEFKQMVQALHKAGLRVVLDVVYNHTNSTGDSNFDLTAPGYFYRFREDGSYSDGSGCGNETASDKPMMRRYMIESVLWWAKEYHIDGFRFDLMGIHDIETMNLIQAALQSYDPSIFVYGEGWSAGTCAYDADKLAMKAKCLEMPGIAAFGDELRDAVRGPFSDDSKGAFLCGLPGNEESIKFGIAGAIEHPELDYEKVNYSNSAWALEPTQMIAYVSCHDDMCLSDRLRNNLPSDEALHLAALKLGETIVLTSQGVPFIFCGEEVFRDKKMVHNSYKSPDSINAIEWERRHTYADIYEYMREMIHIRRDHKAFHMGSAIAVRENLHFLPTEQPCVVAYTLNGAAVGDSWSEIIVAFNGSVDTPAEITIPEGEYKIICQDGKVNSECLGILSGSTATVAPTSALILAR